MTKAEQARRTAWGFKVLLQACERSRNVARTCRHFGIRGRPTTAGNGGMRRTARRVTSRGALPSATGACGAGQYGFELAMKLRPDPSSRERRQESQSLAGDVGRRS